MAPLDPYSEETDSIFPDARRAVEDGQEDNTKGVSSEGSDNVLLVDFSDTQLRLLRIKTRKLEESRYLLYKGLTTVDVPLGNTSVQASVRVLVKHRMVDYYYFDPKSGSRITGRIDATYNCDVDSSRLTWKEVVGLVREFVWKRAKFQGQMLLAPTRGD
jgi:hypothetical protein